MQLALTIVDIPRTIHANPRPRSCLIHEQVVARNPSKWLLVIRPSSCSCYDQAVARIPSKWLLVFRPSSCSYHDQVLASRAVKYHRPARIIS